MIEPSAPSIIFFEIANPKPAPVDLVVKLGKNIFGCTSSGIPGPLSEKVISIYGLAASSLRMTIISPSGAALMACTALRMMLVKTCPICSLSAYAITPASGPIYRIEVPCGLCEVSEMTALSFCATSTSPGCTSGCLANVEKDVAIRERLSISVMSMAVTLSNWASKRSVPLSRWSCWTMSFIEVSGLFISCAIWRAIVRHAPSRSERASCCEERASSSTISL